MLEQGFQSIFCDLCTANQFKGIKVLQQIAIKTIYPLSDKFRR